MKINYDDKLVFDYIIIGAGTAGSVIANRLSEKTTLSILVIEAGKNMNGNILKEIPGKKIFHIKKKFFFSNYL